MRLFGFTCYTVLMVACAFLCPWIAAIAIMNILNAASDS
jgi:hypothetical protein